MLIDAYMHRNSVNIWESPLSYTVSNQFGKWHRGIAMIFLLEGYVRWWKTNNAFCTEQNNDEIWNCRFFDVTSKRWTSFRSLCCYHDSGANGAIHAGGFCTWGVQCWRSFETDRSVVLKHQESTANNTKTVSLQVATKPRTETSPRAKRLVSQWSLLQTKCISHFLALLISTVVECDYRNSACICWGTHANT